MESLVPISSVVTPGATEKDRIIATVPASAADIHVECFELQSDEKKLNQHYLWNKAVTKSNIQHSGIATESHQTQYACLTQCDDVKLRNSSSVIPILVPNDAVAMDRNVAVMGDTPLDIRIEHSSHENKVDSQFVLCEIVYPSFKTTSYFEESDSDSNLYKCEFCHLLFSQWDSFNLHLTEHTKTLKKSHECQICQTVCISSWHLNRHMVTHTGEKPYQCSVCQAVYSHAVTLKRHMRTHTGEVPYQCEVCNAACASQWHLKRHMRTHTGEKPYECEVCQTSFAQTWHLEAHTRTHTGERPYQCETCQRTFSRLWHLNRHIRIHTGERPHKCQVCQASFTRSGRLSRHMLIHTGEKPYRCEVCQAAFSSSQTLKTHVKTHSGTMPPSRVGKPSFSKEAC